MSSDHPEFNPHLFPRERVQQPPSPSAQTRNQQGGGSDLKVPQPRKTKAYTWFFAVCFAILGFVIIVAGLVVLVIYLTFKPRIPRFDVSSVTLKAAYIDTGSLLNADVTLLANFTNPNKKEHSRGSMPLR
ncbi:uncharacterized protein LOC122079958 [Macadamia integrifolia]|uniref:uncharacterized protein LOC122079958 n=1 Tax=Macadamia integrifolia TaxID=60698 RepID=UPI001C4F1943|nr:uncharacterized protein LOC122079958 [Macadamia integrifolia]